MSNKVKLKKVTTSNWEAVVELELSASQEDLVASAYIRLHRHGEVIAVLRL